MMLHEIILASGADKVSMSMALMTKECELSANVVEAICEVYVHVHHVAAGLAWIGSACDGPTSCTSSHVLRSDLETILDIIRDNVAAGEEAIEKCEEEWAELLKSESLLKVDIEMCRTWLAAVRSNLSVCYHLVLSSLCLAVQNLTKLVRQHTVSYDHFLTDTTCSTKLLRSRVLHFSTKEVLTGESVSLFNALAAVARFRAKFGMEVQVGQEDEFQEPISMASLAFSASKKLMFVHSAAQCLLEMSGQEQIKEAMAWVSESKRDKIPKGLVVELQTLLKKKGVVLKAELKVEAKKS
jgi:hypothetical protein